MEKVIGIDLGGTSISGGVVDENGRVLVEKKIKTSNTKEEVLEDIVNLINILLEDNEINKVGIGSPGSIDTEEGKVLSIGGNVADWKGTSIKSYVEDRIENLNVRVDNDANVAGLAEMWIGAGREYNSAVMITLGTGLGGFVYWNNEIIRGARYRASELGHTILYPNGRQCVCGQKGCVERYVSGTGLSENYYELTGKKMSGEEIFENIDKDIDAAKSIDKFIDDLAHFLITIKNFLDPEIIIIGGGVINSSDYWWDEMIESYKSKINSYDNMTITRAEFSNQAGIIGAARLVLDE